MVLARQFGNLALSLELEGSPAGALEDASGGDHVAEVVSAAVGAAMPGRKQLAGSAPQPIVITVGSIAPGPLWTWVAAAFAGTVTSRSGAVIVAGLSESVRLEWTSGLITSIRFADADATSKDPIAMTITIAPEATRWQKGSGKAAPAPAAKANRAMRANFRLDVGGLGDIGRNAVLVSLPELRLILPEAALGATREPVAPARTEYGDLAITVGGQGAPAAADWFDDFVVRGNAAAANERRATFSFLDASLKSDLLTLEIEGIGPFRRDFSSTPFSTDAAARVGIQCYCQSAALTTPAGAAGSPSSSTAPADSPASATPAEPPPSVPPASLAPDAIPRVDPGIRRPSRPQPPG